MDRKLWIVSLGALALMACGDDEDELPMSCGDAAVCPDGGAGTGGSGGSDSGGMGGSGGSDTGGMGGSGGSDTGGMGGSGGSEPDEDSGMMEPVDDASMPMEPLPEDGNQGAVCDDGTDCNQGLDCYGPGGEGRGFCSITCEEDAECESLEGAAYRCSMSTGVCIVECEGEDDTESCPENMVCVNTGGGGGGPGAAWRCKYPDAPPPAGTAQAFEACSEEEPCVDGLVCSGSFGGGTFCTAACELPQGDCEAVASGAGELEPVCAPVGGPGGGGMGRCLLDCSEDAEGCPDGMVCIPMGAPGSGTDRCGFE